MHDYLAHVKIGAQFDPILSSAIIPTWLVVKNAKQIQSNLIVSNAIYFT